IGTGTQGPVGTGTQGPVGTGTQGPVGTGTQGPVGTGTQGPVGTGTQGPVGTGTQGPVGTGTQGPVGTGTQGPVGTGTQGPVGTGTQGPVGTGTQGPVGTGTQGPVGTGTQGPIGTGTQGPIGTGTQGPVGTGTQGPVGTGTQGPVGTGTQGPVGTGTQGPVGTGTQGPVGTGTQGPIGTGTQGPIGTGTQGPIGTGTQGPVGTDTQGPVGTGAQGPAGTGTQGPIGTGTQGPVGTDTQLLSSGTTIASCIPEFDASSMSQYNVITLEDLYTTSDIELTTICCGNLLSGATFANQLSSPWDATVPVLEVNGLLMGSGTMNIQKGSVCLGSYLSNSIINQTSTLYSITNTQCQFTMNGGTGAAVRSCSTLQNKCNQIKSSVINLSQTLCALSPNNMIQTVPNQQNVLNFNVSNCDSNGVAVYNISSTKIFNSVAQNVMMTAPNPNVKFVVINVYDGTINWSSGNLQSPWFQSPSSLDISQVIWNFCQATTVNLGFNIRGGVLAPYATITTNVNIDGACACKSLHTQAEVHHPLINAPNCTSTSTQAAISEF
ncbi:unnamed protein product, partial [Adineta steineri]